MAECRGCGQKNIVLVDGYCLDCATDNVVPDYICSKCNRPVAAAIMKNGRYVCFQCAFGDEYEDV